MKITDTHIYLTPHHPDGRAWADHRICIETNLIEYDSVAGGRSGTWQTPNMSGENFIRFKKTKECIIAMRYIKLQKYQSGNN